MKRSLRVLSLVLAAIALTAGLAFSFPYAFNDITHNSSDDAAAGETQLFLDIAERSGHEVLFTFSNSGPKASSITDIYFDDDIPLLLFSAFMQSPGVDFSVGVVPPDLPGGKDFHFTSNYGYGSDEPVEPNGVNPGETLGILFTMTDGYVFGDVVSALDAGSMTIGIHVQGFEDGGSESFVAVPSPVPEPGTVVLFATGIIGLAVYGKRRRSG